MFRRRHENTHGPTLVEALVSIGVPEERISAAAEEFHIDRDRRLGEHLYRRGLITRQELLRALALQANERGDHREATAHMTAANAEAHSRSMARIVELQRLVLASAGGHR